MNPKASKLSRAMNVVGKTILAIVNLTMAGLAIYIWSEYFRNR